MDALKSLHKSFWVGLLVVLAGMSAPVMVTADDTEIYLTPPGGTSDEPLVMLSLDYRPNLASSICTNTAPGACEAADYFRAQCPTCVLPASGTLNFFEMLQLTLELVLGKVSGVQIGLMLNHNHDQNGEGPSHGSGASSNERKSNGGYIARRFRSLNDSGSLPELLNILRAMPVPQGQQSHSYQGKELFFEFYRYLRGGLVYNGHNGWTDYATNNSNNLDVDGAAYDWDPLIETTNKTQYIAPNFGTCTKIFTINFMFQVSNQENDSDAAISQSVADGGMGFNPGNNNAAFSRVLGYLNQNDLSTAAGFQNVTSYFLMAPPFHTNNVPRAYAEKGGTREPLALTEDPRELVAALEEIFRQILSVSTTFVAASIPVNVFNRAQAVDNVYIAPFQPVLEPGWTGNVKKLRAKRVFSAPDANGKVSQNVVLVDRLNDIADSSDASSAFGGDGRIRFDALTYWADNQGSLMDKGDVNSDGTVETFEADGTTPMNPDGIVTKRDGRVVNRGGSGQFIPGFVDSSAGPGPTNATAGARQLFYDSTPSSLAPLNADAATGTALASDLGVADSTTAQPILRFMRGLNPTGTDARPWLFGDPLHSRPAPINYGTISGYPSQRRPGIFIVVAGNDGYLRMIENTLPNMSTPSSGDAEPASVQSGRELWAFMPRATMKVQSKLLAGSVLSADATHPNYDLSFPTRPFSPHPYTLDGSPTILLKDINGDGTINGADKVYVYIGMRRGGKNYYALDVTDPRSPSMLWTINGGSGDFAELASTFSKPQTGRLRVGSTLRDVLIFGGGYSNNKDFKALGSDDVIGNALFVVDAVTGSLIWKATGNNAGQTASASHFVHSGLVDSIPSDVAIADTDGDFEGLIDRAVVGDTGGKVWRADFAGTDTSNWKLTLLANLGRHNINDKTNDRRFTNEPDIVQSKDDTGPYDGIILGSGDREDPLDGGGVTENWFYLIKDRNIGVGAGANSSLTHDTSGLVDITDVAVPTGGSAAEPVNTATRSAGWKLQLEEGVGEKNLSPAITIGGTIFFTSYLKPGTSSQSSCGPEEGSGLLYAVNLDDGAPARNYDVDGGNGEDPNSAGDRTNDLSSAGIPAQPVYLPPLPPPDPCTGPSCPTGPPPDPESCGVLVMPDGSTEKVDCPPPTPTFWRRLEN